MVPLAAVPGRLHTGLLLCLPVLLVPVVAKKVNCGGHFAKSCAECPQGNGADWCNGDCEWLQGACHDQGASDRFFDEAAEPITLESNDVDFPSNLPEPRPESCKRWEHEDTKPFVDADLRVSVIIPWLGEKWVHLEGTLMSLLKFTPDELVEEYLFISDGNEDSKETELKAMSSKVKVVALKERHGLIRSKTMAVELAKAPVLLFLEAHCIVTPGWLPPLLDRVRVDPKAVAMPVLDFIPPHEWGTYIVGTNGHWRFEWNLNVIHTNPGGLIESNQAEPYPSPAASGGILAIRKDWFKKLGFYDVGMLEWGGDHVEMSFKTWRCGGRVEMVPCSRIGHLFRGPEDRPYDVEVMQVVRNYARLAEVWLPDHLDLFYKLKPEATDFSYDEQEMNELKRKRDELNCENHDWYVKNVDFEMQWEQPRVCHPYTDDDDPFKCKGELVAGRWTVTSKIPRDEFIRLRSKSVHVSMTSDRDQEL